MLVCGINHDGVRQGTFSKGNTRFQHEDIDNVRGPGLKDNRRAINEFSNK